MAYMPSCVYQQDDTRVYSEMTTGEKWHYRQVCLSPNLLKSHNMIQFIKACLANGTTILGIILVSDHTHLTNFTGDKKMHTVYLSIGNISKDVHWKHNSRAWLLVTKIPISKSQRLNFLDLRPNKKLCLGFSVTAYSMNACNEYLNPCDLIRGSTMLCLPLMGILDSVWLS